jgi:SAM-dependent methyltransferase
MSDSATSPSPWIQRFTPLIRPGAKVLDVACGSGRHLRWLVARGFTTIGIDRDEQALAAAQGSGQLIHADIESGTWPLAGQRFGAVVVTNYLWRPLLPTLLASVAVGGVLLYETFAHGQETIGRPKRLDFLLKPAELLQCCAPADWRVVAFEDGFVAHPARFVQRIAAVRADASMRLVHPPERYALD